MKSDFHEWSDVRVFLAVMREGSTLAASKVLGMAQPTVARRIDVLEHVTGLVLFDRSTKGFRPTVAAHALLPLAEAIEAAAADFGEVAARQRTAPLRPIRLSMTPNSLTTNLTSILARFRDAYPGTTFEFVATLDAVDLIKGDADVALRYARSIADERLFRTKMGDVYCSYFASPAYIDRHGLPRSVDEAAGHKFIINERLQGSSEPDQWLLSHISPDQIVARCQDFESVTAAVQTGMGIGVLGRIGATRSGLVRCFDPPDPVFASVWLVTGPDAHRRPEVRAFVADFAPRYAAFLKAEREEVLGTDP
ncbi:LysR family transcriptional regulator [Flavimaricola marinus]|uniref:HTH-type transcriptional regulator YofA n=1 Tax=Flavimaricola marinus TaxID=1819565 RepID=A0A238LHN0_9RHOB|nr:LysR family transcriptional regulator [Flavimaricola marinus]SMY08390.1 HTH-type transcriptional regulator YofA [Flavimaricola marinus]